MRLLTSLFARFSLPATVAITVATVVNYAFSHVLYQQWFVDVMDEVGQHPTLSINTTLFQVIREKSLESWALVRADYHRLLKMKGYWPPHENPAISWAYTLGLYLLFT